MIQDNGFRTCRHCGGISLRPLEHCPRCGSPLPTPDLRIRRNSQEGANVKPHHQSNLGTIITSVCVGIFLISIVVRMSA